MKMTVARPTPCHTSTNATESSAHCGSTSQAGPAIPTTSRAWLIAPFGRVHQHLERQADADHAHQDREERDRAHEATADDRSGEEDREQHADDDLEAAGHRSVDERVREPGYERRLVEELPVVVEPDELLVEQRPAGEAEVERDERRHQEEDGEDQSSGEEEPVRVGALALAAAARAVGRAALAVAAVRGAVDRVCHRLAFPPGVPGPRERARDGHGVVTSPRGRAAGPASRRPGRRAPRRRRPAGSRNPPRR